MSSTENFPQEKIEKGSKRPLDVEGRVLEFPADYKKGQAFVAESVDRFKILDDERKRLLEAFDTQLLDELRNEYLSSPDFSAQEDVLLKKAEAAQAAGKAFEPENGIDNMLMKGSLLKRAESKLTPAQVKEYTGVVNDFILRTGAFAILKEQELAQGQAALEKIKSGAMSSEAVKLPRPILLKLLAVQEQIEEATRQRDAKNLAA